MWQLIAQIKKLSHTTLAKARDVNVKRYSLPIVLQLNVQNKTTELSHWNPRKKKVWHPRVVRRNALWLKEAMVHCTLV